MIEQPPNTEKKPYEKPVLQAIDLAAEEVMAVGCKSPVSSGAGKRAGNCILAGCAGIGS